MWITHFVFMCLCLSGCISYMNVDDATRDSAGGFNLRTAPSWDSSFAHAKSSATGIVLQFTPPPPHEHEQYASLSDSLRNIMSEFRLELFRYPIDTVLRKNDPALLMIGGSIPEYVYEIENLPLTFRAKKNNNEQQAILPIRIDSLTGRYFFIIPDGRYLLRITPWQLQPEPELLKDVVIRRGNFSNVIIQLMPQRIY